MNEKKVIIIAITVIICVGIISATMVMININNNSKNTSNISDNNSTNNSTINNNTTETNNLTQNTNNSSTVKKNKNNSKKSKPYRPAVDSDGITREEADKMGYTYTPKHGGHYIGPHDHWDPQAGCYHD